MAIIDFLQEFNISKRSESFLKTAILNREYNEISCVDSQLYMKRFFKFMRDHVVVDITEKKEDRMNHSFVQRRLTPLNHKKQ